jgi:hypothetical protein
MTKRVCMDCGVSLVSDIRGRPPLRCGECARRWRKRRKERQPVVCKDCGLTFQPPGQTGRPPERCEPCGDNRRREVERAKTKRWRDANPEASRESHRRSWAVQREKPGVLAAKRDKAMVAKYGIDRPTFEAMVAKQGGACAICGGQPNGKGDRFHVDHCHTSGRIRGLLCHSCNTGLGLFADDPARLRAAITYLST